MRDSSAIGGVEVLERRNPQFEGGPTTGAVAEWRIGLHGDPQLNKLAEGKCSRFCGLGHEKMKGQLIVE